MRGRPLLFVVSLALACGNDEDVGGGSGASQSTAPPDGTTTTTEPPTTGVMSTASTGDDTTGDDTTGDDTTGPLPPDPLMVDCGVLPSGAVAAQYSHQPQASGGTPGYKWDAEGLPDGLVMDPDSGKITGAPTTAGVYMVKIIVNDDGGMAVESQCPEITIDDKLTADLDALPGPCLLAGESILPYITGGDGTEIVCSTPKGLGDGDVPQGITIDPASCEIVGTVEETRFGTWAWIVRARQSGVDVFAPYCATQSQQAPNAYAIYAAHSGQADNVLQPLVTTFDPNAPLYFDGDADPYFEVTKELCGNSCFYGFAWSLSSTGLWSGACGMDKDKCSNLCPLIPDPNEPDGDTKIGCSLVPQMMNPKTGFAHELWAKGDTPPAELADRPIVLQWSIDYCVSAADECNNKDEILMNGDGSNLEFAVILHPQP